MYPLSFLFTVDFVTSKVLDMRTQRRVKRGNVEDSFVNVPFSGFSKFCTKEALHYREPLTNN